MKKLCMLVGILFLMILFSGIISAQICDIQDRAVCELEDYVVMGLSGLTNAHGELWDQPNYGFALCCNFGTGDKGCSDNLHPVYGGNVPANKIIGLSSITNAHGEGVNETNYNEADNVCYENLACISTTSCDSDYSMEVLSLSDDTNAHIGAYDDYNTKICCEEIECRIDVNRCSDYDERECNYDPCEDVAETSVEANDQSGEITCGEGYFCYCEWIEDACSPRWDTEPYCGDGEIDPSLSEECDGTNWGLITNCSDLVSTFTGGSLSCVDCRFDVSQCTGGVSGGFCGNEIIQSPNDDGFYETCDNDSLGGKACLDYGLCDDVVGLACYPSGHENNCTFDTTGCVSCETNPNDGNCRWIESTDDNCDDGFLTYSWVGVWTWDQENIGSDPPCEDDYTLDDGKCYYDPTKASDKCTDGSNTVPCPAQIQLPFFGPYSIVLIAVVIALVYIFLTWRKKGKKLKIFELFSSTKSGKRKK